MVHASFAGSLARFPTLQLVQNLKENTTFWATFWACLMTQSLSDYNNVNKVNSSFHDPV